MAIVNMNVRCRMRTAANIEILLVHSTDIWRRAYQVGYCLHTGTAAHVRLPPERICCASVCLSVRLLGRPRRAWLARCRRHSWRRVFVQSFCLPQTTTSTHTSDRFLLAINVGDSVISRGSPHSGKGCFYLQGDSRPYVLYYNAIIDF